MQITHVADYRILGRDDTGYRALHLILTRSGYTLELQVRSRIQHYWAEKIERTSVIYGKHLKEKEGDPAVIGYFKNLSDVFHEIESGRRPAPRQQIEIDNLRVHAEKIIKESDSNHILDSYVNEDIIKTLVQVQIKRQGFNNWIIVFDWNTASFISWNIVDRDSDSACAAYFEAEKFNPAESGFEVVMIGSSDVATIRKTHSHYFGITNYNKVLENLDNSYAEFSREIDIDTGAKQILLALKNRGFWGNKKVCGLSTLKNHYCKSVLGFESSLKALIEKGLVRHRTTNGPISLNPAKTQEINHYLGTSTS